MARFRIGDSNRSLMDIYGHHLQGGTWYSPDGVGVSERVLRSEFPFLEWDGPATEPQKPVAKETPKPAPKKTVNKRK